MAEIVRNRQTLDASAIRQAVADKIHTPHFIDLLRDLERHTFAGWPPDLLAFAHRQFGHAVQTIHALMIYILKLRAQQIVDAPIAEPTPDLGESMIALLSAAVA